MQYLISDHGKNGSLTTQTIVVITFMALKINQEDFKLQAAVNAQIETTGAWSGRRNLFLDSTGDAFKIKS